MQHMLFELLENAGFLKRAAINTGRIASAKRSELVSVAEQSAELTSTSSVSNPDSVFSHTASLSLGGGPTPCASAECRIRRAHELVQFAAFYSDRVFVNNNLFTSSGRFEKIPIDQASKVTSVSKSVFRKSGAGMLGWAAAISAGFYFGFIQSSLLAAANAFGLTKIAADLVGTSAHDTIRHESMYFFWKVRHRARRS